MDFAVLIDRIAVFVNGDDVAVIGVGAVLVGNDGGREAVFVEQDGLTLLVDIVGICHHAVLIDGKFNDLRVTEAFRRQLLFVAVGRVRSQFLFQDVRLIPGYPFVNFGDASIFVYFF